MAQHQRRSGLCLGGLGPIADTTWDGDGAKSGSSDKYAFTDFSIAGSAYTR